jgi:hypothetical protein
VHNGFHIKRLDNSASELKTSSWIKENSAVCEITGFDIEKITKDQLYHISTKLYNEKVGLEQHLSSRTNHKEKICSAQI